MDCADALADALRDDLIDDGCWVHDLARHCMRPRDA
jgi:hypothetical protein